MGAHADQSIYRFRGASSFNMKRLGNADFAGGTRSRLKRDYRSVPEIVDGFSSFAMKMLAGDADNGLGADRDADGHRPELRIVRRAEQQQVALADVIEALRGEG
jgi:superfamily I DNA/RNA helicase